MAHFARVENNIVIQVIVLDNSVVEYRDFPKSEILGQKFIESIGLPGVWLQTSYNNNFRKYYAGVGYTYNVKRDAFIPPQPYPSWSLNKTDLLWYAPVNRPTDGHIYVWNEEGLSWIRDYEGEILQNAESSSELPEYEVE